MVDGLNLPVFISALVVVLGAIITGIFGLANHRVDAKSRVTPTVEQVWTRLNDVEDRLDNEHDARVTVENSLRTLKNIFVGYVNRVQRGGKTDLTPDERMALDDSPVYEDTLGRTELNKIIDDIKG